MSKQEPPCSHRAGGAGAIMRLSQPAVQRSADAELAAIQDVDAGQAEAPV
jgi:hypothetical protein